MSVSLAAFAACMVAGSAVALGYACWPAVAGWVAGRREALIEAHAAEVLPADVLPLRPAVPPAAVVRVPQDPAARVAAPSCRPLAALGPGVFARIVAYNRQETNR